MKKEISEKKILMEELMLRKIGGRYNLKAHGSEKNDLTCELSLHISYHCKIKLPL